MKNDREKQQQGVELLSASESPTSSIGLALLKFKKETEKKQEELESAKESAKTRCKTCFKEIAPTRRCFGHGGGGGGSSDGGSAKASEEKVSIGENKVLTGPRVVEATDELLGEFASMDDSALDSDQSFDSEIIAELISKGQLLVDNDREAKTLTIKLLCEPNELTPKQREELKKYMATVIKEFNEFKKENYLEANAYR